MAFLIIALGGGFWFGPPVDVHLPTGDDIELYSQWEDRSEARKEAKQWVQEVEDQIDRDNQEKEYRQWCDEQENQ